MPLLPEDTDSTTCPYLFGYPRSPHLVAYMTGARIAPAVISRAATTLVERYGYVLLEGADGLAMPLDGILTTPDLVYARAYLAVLATSGRLSGINHALLNLPVC